MKKSDFMQFLSETLPVDVVFGKYLSNADLSQDIGEGYCSVSFVEVRNLYANGEIYVKVEVVHMELITKQIDPVLEQKIENIIDHQKEFSAFTKGQVYSNSEKIYITAYEFDVMLDPEITD